MIRVMNKVQRSGLGTAVVLCVASIAVAGCSSGNSGSQPIADASPGGSASGGGQGSGSGASSSGGSSSGGSTSGSASGGLADAAHNVDGGVGSCLGASELGALGKQRLLIGVSTSDAPTVAAAPFDLRYEYLSGGLFDGTAPCASCATGCTANGTTCANSGSGCAWWGCWQYDQDPPGAYVRGFDTGCASASPAQIPMFTYYEILQSSSAVEGAAEVRAATSATLMTRYFADWRFLLQQIGQATAILHIEPDFWGYAEQLASDPTTLAAAVASANPTDCASMPNTIAGMGQCMISMVRQYAPNALVGLHASAWGTNVDVAMNTDASFDVAGEAAKVAAFLAACGETNADLVIVETSDRDAGYYQSQGRNAWWDATNATLPDFHQDFAWVKALTEALGKPALYWQTPLGNMNQNNTTNHWQDNRVDYFLGHMGELAAAHVLGAAFGAGAADQTLPETDGNNLVTKTNAYASTGGQALCQ